MQKAKIETTPTERPALSCLVLTTNFMLFAQISRLTQFLRLCRRILSGSHRTHAEPRKHDISACLARRPDILALVCRHFSSSNNETCLGFYQGLVINQVKRSESIFVQESHKICSKKTLPRNQVLGVASTITSLQPASSQHHSANDFALPHGNLNSPPSQSPRLPPGAHCCWPGQ